MDTAEQQDAVAELSLDPRVRRQQIATFRAAQLAPHPLECIVMQMAQDREFIDVISVALRLGGKGGWPYAQARAHHKAYRIVACDVLRHMVRRRVLEQHDGDFESALGKCTAIFTLPGAGYEAALSGKHGLPPS